MIDADHPTSQDRHTTFYPTTILMHKEDLNCMLVINETLALPPSPGFISVIFDIDLFRQQAWQSDDEDIWHFLTQLRERKNQVFRESITEKTEELIN